MRRHLLNLIFENKSKGKLVSVITSLPVDEDDSNPIICLLAHKAVAKVKEVHKDLGELADYRYLGIEDEIRVMVDGDK